MTRFVLLRLLGVVYLAAFLSLTTQVVPLLGAHGIMPAADYLGRIVSSYSRWRGFLLLPSLFFLKISDPLLIGLSWLGVALSLAVVCGRANALLLTVLWALYLSFVHIGQLFYSFGWEILLCETGFLAIFLCPLWQSRPFPARPTPVAVIWLFRWLALRVMLGAGLIKLRGDDCWRDLSCLDFHFETQPLPNPLTPLFHFLPAYLHKFGVLVNHLNELVLPFFVFGPRRLRHVAGLSMIAFQGALMVSGNLSFLNWLTMVPLLACLDDGLLRRLLPAALSRAAEHAQATAHESQLGRASVIVICGLVGLLSFSPAANLLSPAQRMNDAYDPFNLVNTYGAFGSIGRERNEVIFEGTRDEVITEATQWQPYEFPCKPGDVHRRPCVISPLHYRLDWQLWFAAMSDAESEPWMLPLVSKLLQNDRATLRLVSKNPFADAPPRHIRVELYRYHLLPYGKRDWWRRERIGTYLPPLSLAELASFGW